MTEKHSIREASPIAGMGRSWTAGSICVVHSTLPSVRLAFLVVRILRTGDARLWLPAGLVIGIGLLNKWTIGFLVVGFLFGIMLGPERRLVANRWFAAGVALALVLWAPNLWWQGIHGWPQLQMFVDLQRTSSGLAPTIAWIPLQFAITGYLGAVLWISGLLRLLRTGEGRPYRALGIAYLSLAVTLGLAAGDKPYYVAGLYFPLMAAGAVSFERWWIRNAGRARRLVVVVALSVPTLVGMPIVLPILPASTLADIPLQDINYDLGEQIGWPALAREIGEAWRTLPETQRTHAMILTSNYGEAGAIVAIRRRPADAVQRAQLRIGGGRRRPSRRQACSRSANSAPRISGVSSVPSSWWARWTMGWMSRTRSKDRASGCAENRTRRFPRCGRTSDTTDECAIRRLPARSSPVGFDPQPSKTRRTSRSGAVDPVSYTPVRIARQPSSSSARARVTEAALKRPGHWISRYLG